MATLIPKKYKEGSFEDAQYQAFGYDDATNNREIRRNNRRFNRYLRSDAGQRRRAEFEAEALEQQRQQEAKETVAQLWKANGGITGIMSSLKNYRNLTTPTPTAPTAPEVSEEPVLVPKVSYWDRVAKQYGFADSNAVRNWQAQNGLVADGKFGNNSRAVWNRLHGVSTTPYWDAVARANGFENAAAVATWQAQHGLVADGKIGTKTLAALQAQNTSTTTPAPETPAVETTTPAVPQSTLKSTPVYNAFDETPVTTVHRIRTNQGSGEEAALQATPTWRSVSVYNAFDENPVTTVNIPPTKKPIPAQPQTQNRNNPPRNVSWQK